MRASQKKSIAVSLAALTLGVVLAASAGPAARPPKPFPPIAIKPIFAPIDRHDFGSGLAIGAPDGALVASSAYEPPDPCGQRRPADAPGDDIGRRLVAVCE